ncbi:unnamed protein product, partial [Urochloa humidicola]
PQRVDAAPRACILSANAAAHFPSRAAPHPSQPHRSLPIPVRRLHHHPHTAAVLRHPRRRLFFHMDPADPLDISKSMVDIMICSENRHPEVRAGIIVECDLKTVFIIADGREFADMIGIDKIIVNFQSGDIVSKGFCIENGLLGVYCTHPYAVFDMTTIEKIKVCDQPLEMSQAVYVYEGLNHRLTPGNITRFFGRQFAHNCPAVNMAEYGAPVINNKGEMVGMCCTFQYHLDAIRVSTLVETINNLHSTLLKVD